MSATHHPRVHRRRRALLAAGTSLLLLAGLSACGNDQPTGKKSGPAQPRSSPASAGEEAASPAVEPRSHNAFEIVGTFPGVIAARGDHHVVTRGQEGTSIGQTLSGLSIWTYDGVLRGETDGAPCQITVADGTEPEETKVFASEEISYPPQGVENGGYRFVLTAYDSTLEQLQTFEVEKFPRSTDRALELPFECPLTATRDGKYLLMGAGSGWYAIDTATYEARFIAPYWPDPENHSGGNHIVIVGDLFVQAAGDGTRVLDPANDLAVVHAYSDPDEGEASAEDRLAAWVAEQTAGGWFSSARSFDTVPDEPATVYLIDDTGDVSHLARFDLANGTIDHGAEATDIATLRVSRDGEVVYVGGSRNGGAWIGAYDPALRERRWNIEGPTNICADSDEQLAVEVNGQIALLDRETGEQDAFTDQVGTTSLGSGGRCAPSTVGGYGWDINDDIVRGNGGEILSYFDQQETS